MSGIVYAILVLPQVLRMGGENKNSARGDAEFCDGEKTCAPGGTRTPNTQFRRLMLYPLSYRRKSNEPIDQ